MWQGTIIVVVTLAFRLPWGCDIATAAAAAAAGLG
jgi:hypothetical protein